MTFHPRAPAKFCCCANGLCGMQAPRHRGCRSFAGHHRIVASGLLSKNWIALLIDACFHASGACSCNQKCADIRKKLCQSKCSTWNDAPCLIHQFVHTLVGDMNGASEISLTYIHGHIFMGTRNSSRGISPGWVAHQKAHEQPQPISAEQSSIFAARRALHGRTRCPAGAGWGKGLFRLAADQHRHLA